MSCTRAAQFPGPITNSGDWPVSGWLTIQYSENAYLHKNLNTSCRDGQTNCIARQTLTHLTRLASPDVFRMIAWDNGVKSLKLRVV